MSSKTTPNWRLAIRCAPRHVCRSQCALPFCPHVIDARRCAACRFNFRCGMRFKAYDRTCLIYYHLQIVSPSSHW